MTPTSTALRGRPQFVRQSITREQVELLSSILGLSGGMRMAVAYVLLDGVTQVAAAESAHVRQPNVARALANVRRLDASIRAAYPARQRAREAANIPT